MTFKLKTQSAATNSLDSCQSVAVFASYTADTDGFLKVGLRHIIIQRFLILALGYEQTDRCGSAKSCASHWEQIPAQLHVDFMLAARVNL